MPLQWTLGIMGNVVHGSMQEFGHSPGMKVQDET